MQATTTKNYTDGRGTALSIQSTENEKYNRLPSVQIPAEHCRYCIRSLSTHWKSLHYCKQARQKQLHRTKTTTAFQVDYDNHTLYKHGKTGRKQSPVRIFTDIPPNKIVLPASEGYRLCCVCRRYVSADNRHCDKCNSCTSKDGRAWKHCGLCKKCVKPSWIHCSSCDRCALPNHSCGSLEEGCFLCGGKGHKRRSCPHHIKTTGCKKMNIKGKKFLKKKVKLNVGKLTHATSVRKKIRKSRKKRLS